MIPSAEPPNDRTPEGPDEHGHREEIAGSGFSAGDLPDDNMPDDELLSAYIDGELTGQQLVSIRKRLEKDSTARQVVAELRALSQALRSLPRESLNQEIRQQVLRRAQREMRTDNTSDPSPEKIDQLSRPAEVFHRTPRRWIWAG